MKTQSCLCPVNQNALERTAAGLAAGEQVTSRQPETRFREMLKKSPWQGELVHSGALCCAACHNTSQNAGVALQLLFLVGSRLTSLTVCLESFKQGDAVMVLRATSLEEGHAR